MRKVSVLGAGTWGTALAIQLAENDNEVTLWSKLPREIDALRVKLPIRRGDTLIRNLLDTGVDLIACKDLS